MPVLDSEKALRGLRQTPLILGIILNTITVEQATLPHPIIGEWNTLFVLCHLGDYEVIYQERLRLILTVDNPHFPIPTPNAQMVMENDYAHQDMTKVLVDLFATRQTTIALLEGLTPEQWQRTGVHPTYGAGTLLDFAVNITLHDVNHIAQIITALGS